MYPIPHVIPAGYVGPTYSGSLNLTATGTFSAPFPEATHYDSMAFGGGTGTLALSGVGTQPGQVSFTATGTLTLSKQFSVYGAGTSASTGTLGLEGGESTDGANVPDVVAVESTVATGPGGLTPAGPSGYTFTTGDVQFALTVYPSGAITQPTVDTTAGGGGWVVAYDSIPTSGPIRVTLVYRVLVGGETASGTLIDRYQGSYIGVLRGVDQATPVATAVAMMVDLVGGGDVPAASVSPPDTDSLLMTLHTITTTAGSYDPSGTIDTPWLMTPSYTQTPYYYGATNTTRLSFEDRTTAGPTGVKRGIVNRPTWPQVALSVAWKSATSVAGSIGLTSSGSLTVGGTPTISGPAAFTSDGTLTTAGTPTLVDGVGLGGVGTLTLTASITATGTVFLTNRGTLTLLAGDAPATPVPEYDARVSDPDITADAYIPQLFFAAVAESDWLASGSTPSNFIARVGPDEWSGNADIME